MTSAHQWFPNLPGNWEIARLGACFEQVRETVNEELGIVTVFRDGEVTLRSNRRSEGYTEATDYSLYQVIKPGHLAIHNMDAFAGAVGVSDSHGMCSPVVTVCRPKTNVNAKYFSWVLREMARSGWIEANAKSVRERTSEFRWPMAKSQLVPLPPRAEQDAIVEFLDKELQEIDELQVRNTRLLQQLNLRRESLISSYVEDKRSDWPWVPLKYEVGLNPDVLPEDTDPNEVLHYIEIGDVNLEQGISGFTPVAFSEAPSRARRLVRNGDVLISTVRTYLKAIGQVGEPQSENKKVASTGFAVLRPNRIEPRFLKYTVSSDTFIQNIQAYSTGISYPAINASQLVKFKIPVPPFALQVEIADSLDRKLASIDKLQKQTTNLVFTLQERRSSIISSAVTGQIDLRGGPNG